MTDWRDMEAGEELDTLIAERLGKNVQYAADHAEGDRFFGGQMFGTNREWLSVWTIEDDNPFVGQPIPEYSTDLNAAFTLKVEGTSLTVRQLPDNEHWLAEYYKIKGSHGMGYEADTPALAICRAWLAWHDAINRQEDH